MAALAVHHSASTTQGRGVLEDVVTGQADSPKKGPARSLVQDKTVQTAGLHRREATEGEPTHKGTGCSS